MYNTLFDFVRSQKDIAKVKTEIEKHLKTTNEVNETTETLKKLAIQNTTEETEVVKTEQQINGNEPSSSFNGTKVTVKATSTS